MRKLTVLAALLLLVPTVSQAKSLEDLLVEKGVITKSEARAAHHESAAKVYWKDGSRLDFADEGFSTAIYTKIRTRYEFLDVDNDVNPGADNQSGFSVQTARLGVQGSALHNEFEYNVEVEFGQGERGLENDGATLLEANLQWNACDWGNVRMGQFRPDISRGFSTRINNLQFADRSIVSDYFSIQRNQGVRGQLDVNEDWTVAAALFNGNSTAEGINSQGFDSKHLGVVSVRGDLMGEMDAFVEGDIDHTEDAALNFGAAVGYGENELDIAGGSVDTTTISTDVNFKYQGWSAHGEFFHLEHDIESANDKSKATGFYVQGGYFLAPKEWEIAARYGRIACEDGGLPGLGNDIAGGLAGTDNACVGSQGNAVDDVNSYEVAVNYYWWKHNLKAQLVWARIDSDFLNGNVNGESDEQENRWIVQLSSYF